MQVRPDPEGEPLAGTLGWTTGVPGAQVHLLRNGTAEWETVTADASGRVVFDRLLPDLYRLYATRRLTAAEAQAAGEPVRAFGDGATITVPAGPSTATLQIFPDRADGLVISEINSSAPPPWETQGTYRDGHYFELHNNSDQVWHLDGMLFGSAYHLGFQDWDHAPCPVTRTVRTDPLGLHAKEILRFPGSGSQYPVLPGETKLVAIAAIDHTPVHPWLHDLSGAHFELGGHRTADNPAVPNMLDVGMFPFFPQNAAPPLVATGHVLFLAEPVPVGSLPISFRDHNGRGYVRIPAAALVDVASFYALFPDQDRDHPPCVPMALEAFDRYEVAVNELGDGEGANLSYQRLLLRMDGGRAILQNTNTTAADFAFTTHTPGTIAP